MNWLKKKQEKTTGNNILVRKCATKGLFDRLTI